MGKPGGFLEYQRLDDRSRDVLERIKNFDEFHTPLNEEERREQGARCMDCGIPMCQSALNLKGMVTGCPLHNLVPEWNDEVYHGRHKQALTRLLKTNNFPEFTGRVCPSLCEKACICGMDAEPVTIHDNELFIIESGFAEGNMVPRISKQKSGKRVAVVGSGPSGLAVADQLCHRGHDVTVYERDDAIGGLLMYGIPNMKLDKSVIERRRKLMEEEGVHFITGVNVGVDVTAKELLKEFDAVALCTGAKEPRALTAKGADKKVSGLYFAVDFLSQVTKCVVEDKAAEAEGTKPTKVEEIGRQVKGKHVIVLGGGDTGNDCVGTSVRLGAKSVTQLEMMPKPPEKRREDNPWPEWPKTLKTDYGQEEAIAVYGHDPRIFETTIKELITEKGKLKAVITVQVGFANGKLTEVEGTEKELPCDLLLIAAGFIGCQKYTAEAFGVGLTQRGVVATKEGSYATNVEGVFSAGDMRRGQSLVVWAITEGRACAREMDQYLMGYSDMED